MSKLCELCGNPMPLGEEMFRCHGYSYDCPPTNQKKLDELKIASDISKKDLPSEHIVPSHNMLSNTEREELKEKIASQLYYDKLATTVELDKILQLIDSYVDKKGNEARTDEVKMARTGAGSFTQYYPNRLRELQQETKK